MKYKRWTIEEEDYIRKNYNVLPIKKIANKIGVTIKQIYGLIILIQNLNLLVKMGILAMKLHRGEVKQELKD